MRLTRVREESEWWPTLRAPLLPTYLFTLLGYLGGPLLLSAVLAGAAAFSPAHQRDRRHQVALGEALGGGGRHADRGGPRTGDRRISADGRRDLHHRGAALQEVRLHQLGEGGDHLAVLDAATL